VSAEIPSALSRKPHIDTSSGHLALEGEGVYVVFQTSLYPEESMCLNRQWFTYGRVMTTSRAKDTLRLERSEAAHGMLLPVGEAPFDVTYHQNILVLPKHEVGSFISQLGDLAVGQVQMGGTPSAERLYRTVGGKEIGGVVFDACAIYEQDEGGLKMFMVDGQGGFSVGVPPREGIVTDAYLADLSAHDAPARRVGEPLAPTE
jgi:hypothetical protein